MQVSRRTLFPWVVVGAVLLACLALGLQRWADGQARREGLAAARQSAALRAGMLASELQKFQLLPVAIPEYPLVASALRDPTPTTLRDLDLTFESLARRTDASAIYLIAPSGDTIAASNWREPASFVGQNYAFRPYFQQALTKGEAQLFALGTVSNRAGLYLARRVDADGRPAGVLVVKVEFAKLQAVWAAQPGITAVADDHGVIIISSRTDWLFRSLAPLPSAVRRDIGRALQFGTQDVRPLAIASDGAHTVHIGGEDYVRATEPVPLLGATLISFQPLAPGRRAAHAVARLTLLVVFALTLLVGGLVLRSRERRALLVAARESLEEEVATRTAELRDANAELQATVAARAETDRQYRRAREELAQANRLGSIGQITAGVAHEINQPVAAIRTFAENAGILIDRGCRDDARGNIATIVSLTDRIGAITAELRAFARRGTPPIEAVNLAAVIDGTLLLTGDGVRAAGITLEQVATDSSTSVIADRVRLEQILVNLIQNAIHALAETTSPVIRITVSDATIVVADNGPGIAPSLARDVFTPFVTSKSDGLGLGLGIARDIAREFGGDLSIVPSPLGGAAFELRLRRAS